MSCKIWFCSDDVGGLSEYSVKFISIFVFISFFSSSLTQSVSVADYNRRHYYVFPRNDVTFGGRDENAVYL